MPIEPHASLEGPRLAGWIPRETSPAEHRLQEGEVVPLPDGLVPRCARKDGGCFLCSKPSSRSWN